MTDGWMEETNREVLQWAEDLLFAEQDRANGAALRRLVESGMVFAVSHTARGWVLMDYGTAATVVRPTLAAAVTAALER